jgi:hypothetical protein
MRSMSIGQKLALAARVAVIGGHVLGEKVTRRRPTHLAEVPGSPEALTPEWLTAALFRNRPGARVTGVRMGDRSDGSTSRQVLLLEYNDAGLGSGIPQRVFSKSSPHFTSRLITGLTGALQNEAGFYMTLRPQVEMETPIGYDAGVDDASGRSMFLLEDVADTHGARFGDPTPLQVDRAMAESMVENLAAYHGRFWESELLDQSWIQTSLGFQQRVNATIDFEKRSLIGIERSESIAPVEFLRRRDAVWGATMRSLELKVSGPHTLLHSDMHLGNWYLNRDGRRWSSRAASRTGGRSSPPRCSASIWCIWAPGSSRPTRVPPMTTTAARSSIPRSTTCDSPPVSAGSPRACWPAGSTAPTPYRMHPTGSPRID